MDWRGYKMNDIRLYRGVWPQVISKLAKYAVRFVDGEWRATVLYEAGQGLRYLAVEGASPRLVEMVNSIKRFAHEQPGGAFYINEYHHLIVPVRASSPDGRGSECYFAGLLQDELRFDFEGKPLTTRPIRIDGKPLNAGEPWVGPRPGIPYVLAAGGGDIYYETPALTDEDPPRLRPRMTRRVQLSRVLGDQGLLRRAVKPMVDIRGHQGGRFYVNEHGAIFSPMTMGDGNGIDYVYCGQIDRGAWFPEPPVEALPLPAN
jgi:hypothetical protein